MFPVYKDSGTIKKMIYQSLKVLREVSRKFEIIIVDDGCPDQTGIIAKKIDIFMSDIIKLIITLVRLLGFEPRTSWSVAKRSIQLSYRRNSYRLFILNYIFVERNNNST